MSYPTEADLRRDERERAALGLTRPKAEAWRPAEGEQLIGHLARVEHGESKYGTYPILIVVDGDGVEHAVWLMPSVLRQEVVEADPQIGDAIAIVYEGKQKPKGGGDEYKAFKLVVSPAAGSRIDWQAGGRRVAGISAEQLQVEPRPPAEAPEPPLEEPMSTDFPGQPFGPGDTITTAPEGPPFCSSCGGRLPFHEHDCPQDPPPY